MGTTTLTDQELEHFDRYGYLRVSGAFTADEAAAMCDVVWHELESRGIRRADPTTWTEEFPDHLQHLRKAPEFQAVGSPRTLGAIADLLGPVRAEPPKDWGAYFLLFPTKRPWTVPWKAWHVDHDWTDPLTPLVGLKVHAMLAPVEPRAGGMTIVAGSHHVVARILEDDPPPADARAAQIRARVMRGHPYLRDLSIDDQGDPDQRAARIARFHDREEEVLGHGLRVVELTADAGDVILIHPLVLHTRPTNAGTAPRILLNKDLYPPRKE